VDQRTPSSLSVRPIYAETHAAIECILQFGRDLHAMGEQMKREFGENEANNKALKVCVVRQNHCPIMHGFVYETTSVDKPLLEYKRE